VQCGIAYTVENADINDKAYAKFTDIFQKNHLTLVRT